MSLTNQKCLMFCCWCSRGPALKSRKQSYRSASSPYRSTLYVSCYRAILGNKQMMQCKLCNHECVVFHFSPARALVYFALSSFKMTSGTNWAGIVKQDTLDWATNMLPYYMIVYEHEQRAFKIPWDV